MADLTDSDALLKLPADALEELVGAKLLEVSQGMKPPDSSTKRTAARNWWRSHLSVLRDAICNNSVIREKLFHGSEKDRNTAIATLIDTLAALYTGIPVASLIVLTCHYGVDKICPKATEGEVGQP